ncbi:MAG: glycosyltransferase [Thermomicrobiales bacterium]
MASTQPHVLFVTGEYPPHRGGIADYTFRLRSEIDNQGYGSYVLTLDGAEGPSVFTIGSWSWPVALQIREIAAERRVDLIHIQYQAGAFDMHPAINALPTTLSAWLRIPVVTTFHDLRVPYLFPKAGRLRNAVMLRMARASDRAIVTDPGDQRVLEQAEIETVRIPLGPSLPAPDGATSPNGTAKTVGYFGFPSREKGLLDLVEALAKFPDIERPKLLLVGAPQPDSGTHKFLALDEIETFAGEAGVGLEVTGYLPPQAASNRLAGCSAVSLPFPNGASQRSSALIAALNLGRPVVTTASDLRSDLDTLADLPQLITALPGDVDSLHYEIGRALAIGVEQKPLPEEFTWTQIGKRHARMYDELLSAAGHRG